MKTLNQKLLITALIAPLFFCACSNKGSSKQQDKFKEVVALEGNTLSIPIRLAGYMEVVSMDPGSDTGKAARERVDQLSREMESVLGPQ